MSCADSIIAYAVPAFRNDLATSKQPPFETTLPRSGMALPAFARFVLLHSWWKPLQEKPMQLSCNLEKPSKSVFRKLEKTRKNRFGLALSFWLSIMKTLFRTFVFLTQPDLTRLLIDLRGSTWLNQWHNRQLLSAKAYCSMLAEFHFIF